MDMEGYGGSISDLLFDVNVEVESLDGHSMDLNFTSITSMIINQS
jgi:hypothetical protein